MLINTEFGHSARFLFSFKAVCAVENGPPRLPVPSFVSNFICVGPPHTAIQYSSRERVEHCEIGNILN